MSAFLVPSSFGLQHHRHMRKCYSCLTSQQAFKACAMSSATLEHGAQLGMFMFQDHENSSWMFSPLSTCSFRIAAEMCFGILQAARRIMPGPICLMLTQDSPHHCPSFAMARCWPLNISIE